MIGLASRRVRLPDRPRAGEVVLCARGLCVRRGARTVLDAIDLDVRAGQLLALVGPNGAGKSTLLGALAGDLAPHAGAVRLAGRDAGDWPPAVAARWRAVLPQQNVLSFPFPVRDVVAMGRAPWRGTPLADDDEAIVADAMTATAVLEIAEQRFPTLSGGEAARVSMARVLAQRTPVLLLDEPTASLDPHHQEALFSLLRRRADDGDAVVAVLHDLELAAAYADTVAVLARGRVLAAGAPGEVLTEVVLSAAYGHPMEVVAHPRTGRPVIAPRR